jgi:hypothetical protein
VRPRHSFPLSSPVGFRSSAQHDSAFILRIIVLFPVSSPWHPRCKSPMQEGEWRRGMGKHFKVGDHVSWNSEAGRVSGRIVKVHTKDVGYKGYVHHASKDDPQYAIKSDKTDHVALHKGGALRRIRR